MAGRGLEAMKAAGKTHRGAVAGVLPGSQLDLLGVREPETYGREKAG